MGGGLTPLNGGARNTVILIFKRADEMGLRKCVFPLLPNLRNQAFLFFVKISIKWRVSRSIYYYYDAFF